MAGITYCCSSALSSRSNLGAFSLVFNINRGGIKQIARRRLRINAEIEYVNADEAKKLISEEGYSIVDVRDRIQYERAHIKSCSHVPLFIENQDNDLGKSISTALSAGAALAATSAAIDVGGQTTRIDNGWEYYPYTTKKRVDAN